MSQEQHTIEVKQGNDTDLPKFTVEQVKSMSDRELEDQLGRCRGGALDNGKLFDGVQAERGKALVFLQRARTEGLPPIIQELFEEKDPRILDALIVKKIGGLSKIVERYQKSATAFEEAVAVLEAEATTRAAQKHHNTLNWARRLKD